MTETTQTDERMGNDEFFRVGLLYLALFTLFLLARPLWLTRVAEWTDADEIQELASEADRRLELTGAVVPLAVAPDPAGVPPMGGLEAEIFELTNGIRRKNGLAELVAEPTLALIAREHSSDMANRDYFDHVSPEGKGPGDRVATRHRRLVGLASENIGKVSIAGAADLLAEELMAHWMNSPGHRGNILRAGSTHLGVGVTQDGNTYHATKCFASVWAYLDDDLPKSLPVGGDLVLAGRSALPDHEVARVGLQRPGSSPASLAAAAVRMIDDRFSAELSGPASPGPLHLAVEFSNGAAGQMVPNGPRLEAVGP